MKKEINFKKLCEYKKVDSFGQSLKNCDVIVPERNSKNCWNRYYLNIIGEYKFMITFENNLANGIVTEKIYNAFMGNTLPIYWGNAEINKHFNKDSFINYHDYNTDEEVINFIKKIDTDDELYYKMLNSQKLHANSQDYYRNQYKNIWKNVLFNFN